MKWNIGLSADRTYIVITTEGQFTLADQRKMFLDLSAFQAGSPDLPILFDNRHIEMTGSNLNIIRESVIIVQDFIRSHGVSRLAGMVNEGVNFGVGRQFEIMTDVVGGHGFRLFHDENLAISWLRGEML